MLATEQAQPDVATNDVDPPQPPLVTTIQPSTDNSYPNKIETLDMGDPISNTIKTNGDDSISDFYRKEDECCCHVALCCHQPMTDILHNTVLPKDLQGSGGFILKVLTLASKIIGIILLVFLSFWNITKLPYYLVDSDSQPMNDLNYNATYCNATVPLPYICHGVEGSINLGHWIENYRGGKITAPPVFFLAVHLILGVTVLLMAAATIVFPKFRRQYSAPFFIFSIILGAHTMPATLLVSPLPKVALFSFTAVGVMFCGVLGLLTIWFYDRIGEHHAERLLIACFTIITIGSCGAGMAEFGQIFSNIDSHAETGEWPLISGNRPSPNSGRTVFDGDSLETFGWVWACLWIIIVWGVLPTVEVLIWRGVLPENTWALVGNKMLTPVSCLWSSGGKAKIEPTEVV